MSERNITNKDRLIAGGMTTLIGMAAIGDAAVEHDLNNIQSHSLQLLSQDTLTHLDPIKFKDVSEVTTSSITIKKPAVKVEMKKPDDSTVINTPMVLSPTPEQSSVPAEKLINLNLDKSHITLSDYEHMSANTVYLKNGGCSGSLIRNEQGVPIAETEAQHCFLRASTNPRILGSDGKEYIVQQNLVEAQTGSAKYALKTVGVIKQYLLPKADDRSSDFAIGIFEGHTAAEALAAYNSNKLSAKEISKIKLGDKASLSGWPVVQKNINNPNYEKRQDFPLTILGKTDGNSATPADGWTYNNMIWAAIPTSKNGSICSQGDSGGEVTMVINGKRMKLGTLSLFKPFTTDYNMGAFNLTQEGADTNRAQVEKDFKIDTTNMLGICGITTGTLANVEDGEVIEAVTSFNDIPCNYNYSSDDIENSSQIDQLIQKAHDEFFDPNYVKTWVRGAINLDPNGKGNWKMNPLIFYDNKSGGAVIGSYTDNSKDGLELDYLPDFKDQKFNGDPALFNESGVIDVFTNQNNTNGFINASGGQIFGQNIQNDPNTIEFIQNDPAFSIYYDNSTQSLQIMQYKHN